MKVFLKRKNSNINAVGEYDIATKTLTVLKGSVVSSTVAHTAKFRGTKSIEKSREGSVVNCVVQKDVPFSSASTAANYVTGTSSNGLVVWKDANGKSIKELMSEA